MGWRTAGRAEHFALIPVPRRRLAADLLGAAFAGITTAVTLLAFISLVVFGARLGVLPALVGVPAVVLQLVLVVLLSRLAVTGFGQAVRRLMAAVGSSGAFCWVNDRSCRVNWQVVDWRMA